MPAVAIDVVLLPDEAMRDMAIAANAELVRNFKSEIILNKDDCLPHISLAMGCVNQEDIVKIGELLEPLAGISPKRLKPGGIQKSTNFSGDIISVLLVEPGEPLQTLHEKICDAVKPFCGTEVSEEMIAGGYASRTSLQWIATYFDNAAHSNFSPHITIGYGDLSDIAFPADFAVSRLAICHLGNHCTCREILWSVGI